jgi:apolipoprotein N-acyltransferase
MGADLTPRARLARLVPAFALLAAASPGVAFPEGSAVLAIAALVLWGLAASRPGKHAFWLEVLLGALAWSWICSWAAHVWWGTLLVIGPGKGLYMGLAGVLLRRLAPRWPLALALPAAWIAVDSLRSLAPPPLGMSWMRLGTHLSDVGPLLASARVWGFAGLGWVLAAAAGAAADVVRERRALPWSLALGAAPALVALALGRLVGPGAFEPGPRVLLIQPDIAQERKMSQQDDAELFALSLELTRRGIADARARELGDPDLVCWGETMLPVAIAAPGLEVAVREGARWPDWYTWELEPEQVAGMRAQARVWVEELLLGRRRGGVLPPGTSFLAGAQHLRAVDGIVRRGNSVLLWDAAHGLGAPVDKLVRVPGTETMLGLERFGWVRSVIRSLAGYLPDLHSDLAAPRALTFTSREGRTWRIGASVCFDNAFDEAFARPLREGPLDFHLVASNEAWFHRSLEFDQMLAFTRVEAVATGRAVVRATNSGITCLVDAQGRVVERLVVDGRDRDVPGWLQVTVPVPAGAGGAARRTPFVRSGSLAAWASLLVPVALLALRRRREDEGAAA